MHQQRSNTLLQVIFTCTFRVDPVSSSSVANNTRVISSSCNLNVYVLQLQGQAVEWPQLAVHHQYHVEISLVVSHIEDQYSIEAVRAYNYEGREVSCIGKVDD